MSEQILDGRHDGLDTEGRILLAAETEFMEKGFAGARTTSIANAAGVTHAMFHYYFRTKEKLFESIIERKVGLVGKLLTETVEDADAPLDVLIPNIITRHMDFLEDNVNLPRFLVGEVFSNPERLRVVRQKVKYFVPAIVKELQNRIDLEAEQRRCRRVDALMLIFDIISLNLFTFMARPIINAVLGELDVDRCDFLERRKKENIETIMRKLMI